MSHKRKRGSTNSVFKISAASSPAFFNFHDPVLDNPLDAEFESLISQVGERRFLAESIKRFGIEMSKSIDELSDHECRKVIRGIVRNCEDYSGPEMKQ